MALKDPPRWGTLVRSIDNPRLFYSFGPWPTIETITAMRAHPGSTEVLGKWIDLCEETDLGTYLVETTAGEAPQVT